VSHHVDWIPRLPSIRRMLVNGRTLAEIAEMLGTSVSTVKKLISDHKLREPLEPKVMPPGFAHGAVSQPYTAKPKQRP
jgi:Sigma-70, region 4